MRKKEFNLIDLGIAAEHFSLQAAEEGLGTCILGWFDEKSKKNPGDPLREKGGPHYYPGLPER